MLNGTSDDERDTVGSSGVLSPFAFPLPKSFPRICSVLDMTGSDQRAGCVRDVVVGGQEWAASDKEEKTRQQVLNEPRKPEVSPNLTGACRQRVRRR